MVLAWPPSVWEESKVDVVADVGIQWRAFIHFLWVLGLGIGAF